MRERERHTHTQSQTGTPDRYTGFKKVERVTETRQGYGLIETHRNRQKIHAPPQKKKKTERKKKQNKNH